MVVVVKSLSHVRLFATPWTAVLQASLPFIISQSLHKLMSIESLMPSNQLIFCHPLLFLPSIFPSIRVFSIESALCISWPQLLELQDSRDRTKEPVPERSLKRPMQARRNKHTQDFQGIVSKVDNWLWFANCSAFTFLQRPRMNSVRAVQGLRTRDGKLKVTAPFTKVVPNHSATADGGVFRCGCHSVPWVKD